MNKPEFKITFWGVRGSCPTPSQDKQKFGGNTSCVEVEIGERLIIFDAGTGIIQLGNYLTNKHKNIQADIFISHVHWDHIQGFPFFSPAFIKGNSFTIYGESKKEQTFEDIIKGIMKYPYFPTEWDEMAAELLIKEIRGNTKFNLGNNIYLSTLSTSHPSGCLGYRIDFEDRSCCYVTDIEYNEQDSSLHKFIKDTDILILDAQFTDEEYMGNNQIIPKTGWGHSTWQKAVKLANKMKIKNLILFHHDINRSDSELEEIEKKAQLIYSSTSVAKEGLIVKI